MRKKKDYTVISYLFFGLTGPHISVLLQEISMPEQDTNPICRLKQFPINL
jgi:hypothetical protein